MEYGNDQDKAYDRVKAKQVGSEKAKGVLRGAGYARGGGVSPAKKKMKKVEGEKPAMRADKYARGGSVPKGKHAGHHTKIIINAGGNPADKAAAMQQGMKMGATMAAQKLGAGGPRPGAGAPPMARPMPPPPGAGAPPPGAGAPPGGMSMAACGGRQYKRGGAVGPKKVPGVTNISEGGGGGARGRLEKMAKYGTKPKK